MNQLKEKNEFAPIAIFAYKRLDTLKLAVDALLNCKLANETKVYFFCDGPKITADMEQIEQVRDYINSISGFQSITKNFSPKNKGLANSIIQGTTEILNKHGSVIVLEDDLLVSTNFINYMNAALQFYQSDQSVYSVSAYTAPIICPNGYSYDNYFTMRSSSWGWATWKNRWEGIDWNVSDYQAFRKNKIAQKQFNAMGSDMCKMLHDQHLGKIDSWAVRWMYHQFKVQKYTVYPIISKINNIGFGGNATHTDAVMDQRFKTPLDKTNEHTFNFKEIVALDTYFTKQFISLFSIKTRIIYKLKSMFLRQ